MGGVSFVNMKIITAYWVLALTLITARSEQLSSSNTVEMNALKKALVDAHTGAFLNQ